MGRRLFTTGILVAGAVAAAGASARPAGRAVDARVGVGTCEATLRARPEEPVLSYRQSCELSSQQTRDALAELLAKAFPGTKVRDPVSLSMGRIVDYPWLSIALARSAIASPGWDAAKGQARAGSDNRFVADLLRERALLDDLLPAFAGVGARARVAGVEKVLVAPLARVPALGLLGAHGAPPGARVPYDAQLWLRLEPEDVR